MNRYRVRLILNEYEWSTGDKVSNQVIALFKPEQTLEKDLSYMFSNYAELDEEAKVYASSVADDLFSHEEIKELINLFGMRSELQIIIYSGVKLPFLYSNEGGISIVPEDRRTRYVSFEGTEKLSFPLTGFVRKGRHLKL